MKFNQLHFEFPIFNMAKRTGVENQFCVVPRKSIKLLGESVGINYLSSEVAASLAEDTSYRIRQTVQSASQFVQHSKRDHMTGEDINRALFWSHVEPIYGYGSKNSNIFSNISTKEGDLYFHEDKEINLRELAFSKGFSSLGDLGSCEISVEVSVLEKMSVCKGDSQSDAHSSGAKHPEFDSLKPVLKSYYDQVTRNIIFADDKTVKLIFCDLRTNGRIQVILPYLVNFISAAMQILIDDSQKLLRVFGLIKALIENKHLYLEPYVVQLVRAVMYCLIENPVSNISMGWLDDQILRNRAAQTLCHIDRKCNNAGNFLHLQLIRTFKDIYNANDQPLHSQYGAVTGLALLDVDAVEQTIFPHLKEYSEYLVNLLEGEPMPEKRKKILGILDMLKMSAIFVFRNKLRTIAVAREKQDQLQTSRGNKASASGTDSSYKSCLTEQMKWNQHVPAWYKLMYDVIGDPLVLILGNLEDYENFIQSKTCVANNPRNSLLNHSRLQYIRRMIQIALQSREQKSSVFLEFSLQAEKTRRVHELSMLDEVNAGRQTYLSFLDYHKSELRFENLLEKSLRAISSFDSKACTVRLPCLSAKRRSFRRSIALLSFPF